MGKLLPWNEPLAQLCSKKFKFKLVPKEQDTFDQMKHVVVGDINNFLDFETFSIHTDASIL